MYPHPLSSPSLHSFPWAFHRAFVRIVGCLRARETCAELRGSVRWLWLVTDEDDVQRADRDGRSTVVLTEHEAAVYVGKLRRGRRQGNEAVNLLKLCVLALRS